MTSARVISDSGLRRLDADIAINCFGWSWWAHTKQWIRVLYPPVPPANSAGPEWCRHNFGGWMRLCTDREQMHGLGSESIPIAEDWDRCCSYMDERGRILKSELPRYSTSMADINLVLYWLGETLLKAENRISVAGLKKEAENICRHSDPPFDRGLLIKSCDFGRTWETSASYPYLSGKDKTDVVIEVHHHTSESIPESICRVALAVSGLAKNLLGHPEQIDQAAD